MFFPTSRTLAPLLIFCLLIVHLLGCRSENLSHQHSLAEVKKNWEVVVQPHFPYIKIQIQNAEPKILELIPWKFPQPFIEEIQKASGQTESQWLKSLQYFLALSEAQLPEPFLKNLPQQKKIKVQFIWDQSPTGQKQLIQNPCVTQEGIIQKQILGSVEHNTGIITLNALLITEILRGIENSISFDCGHRNYYRTAMAVVVHELAHLYDRVTLASKMQQFLNLSGWVNTGLIFRSREQGNTLIHSDNSRSPDIYEYEHPREAFAVNMEFFLLDPEYACRRPAMHLYLKRHFGLDPLHEFRKCQVNTILNAYSTNGGHIQMADLNPEQIFEVHYLFASAGPEIMSRWGHAMYRIVICQEGEELNEDCRLNITDHVVLSYRANIRDLMLDYFKGFFGGYPSQLFIFPFVEVQNEYTKDQFRDLISLPIVFSKDPAENREDLKLFIYQALAHNWEYQGYYYFLTNNCATEALNLLKGVVQQKKLQKSKGKTPSGLYDRLSSLGIIDESVLADSHTAIEKSFYFPSRKDIYETAFSKLKKYPVYERFDDFEEYVSNTKAEQRKNLYDHTLKTSLKDQEANLKEGAELAGALWALESFQSRKFNLNISNKVVAYSMGDIAQAGGDDKVMPDIKIIADLALELQMMHADSDAAGTTRRGYGIPLSSDLDPELPHIQERDEVRAHKFKILEETIDRVFAPIEEEKSIIAENLDYFLSERRRFMEMRKKSEKQP